ncbi:hypothetical protein [Paenibacillus wynnii]|uniref:Uncharacterized protein n=1 Tax=Paenibacillus wynnii TaxID=268407 RepID=A0A098MEY5_9BACL|nr:hypothetical protein [Paenibacillus wynnii]KGE21094.1 hypothetical protein PWYN_02860 [Paenibacillus wynnii]
MNLDLMTVPAKFVPISRSVEKTLLKTIRKAMDKSKQYNFVDESTNISYCVSFNMYQKGALAVSVVDFDLLPNASVLNLLEPIFGEPTKQFSNPWVRDNRAIFYLAVWERVMVAKRF